MVSKQKSPSGLFKELSNRKALNGDVPIVVLTAYDAPTTRFAHDADIILVGDSAAMVVMGYESTMSITHNEMLMLVKSVSRTNEKSDNKKPIIADMVWGSYHVSIEKTIESAIELIHAGAHAVKVEGGKKRVEVIKALVNAEIPVVGHIGLTPQSILSLGKYSVSGKDFNDAQSVLADAHSVVDAGVSMLVVECVPDGLSRTITEELNVPVIGIGAGRHVDGQVLVIHDLLGIKDGSKDPTKFVREYAQVENIAKDAVTNFMQDVKSGAFPTSKETYHMSDDLDKYLKSAKAGLVQEISKQDSTLSE